MNGLPELQTYRSPGLGQALMTGYQLRNLRARQGLEELGLAEKLATTERLQAEEERKQKKFDAERQLSAVKYGARLLHNVTDEASYQDALLRFSQAYPEYAKTIPTEYDPANVKRMVGWGLAYEKMSDQRSTVGKLLRERDALPPNDPSRAVLDQDIAKKITRPGFKVTPDGEGGFNVVEEEVVPDKVKQAQALVVKFAESVDPTVAALIAANPKHANNPIIQNMLAGTKVPEDLKPAYDEAIKILNDFYGAKQTETPVTPGGVTHVFEPGKGLVPVSQ